MANRLSNESSPYLLQHKDNPVDWYPWSAEALNRARSGDKPIFLSIGYSACHWCHVMEHESFENEQIAGYLNENFVSIKVDREERPDLDHIYMQAVMAMQGHGGWPLSAFLTPDQDFFFGGTYWPPGTTAQMPGFDRVLASVLDAWHNRRDQVLDQSRQITAMINQSTAVPEASSDIDSSLLQIAARTMHDRFDITWGGFGSAPKFPQPMDLSLLLNLYEHPVHDGSGESDSPSQHELLEMVEVTLRKMYQGGIYDHLGGGFARYSVDARWLVPHFEKMLYDNALLARVYLHAGQVTGDRFYHDVCEETLKYLSDYMTDSSGGMHSTEDADSEGEEGKFYVWTDAEIKKVLGPDTGTRFCQLYNVTPSGNFEGRNILHLTGSFDEFAGSIDVDRQSFREEIRTARVRLLGIRDKRIRPGLDDKILTSWNALAIQAFSEAAVVLENDTYADRACRAAEFVWTHLRDDKGRLLHTWRNGVAKIGAFLDDYAYLINAYVSLYRVRFDDQWIARASELATAMLEHFHDERTGAFFFTADDQEQLIARPCEFQDTAVPSGNSMAATALLRLGRIQGKQQLVDLAKQTMLASLPLLNRAPHAASQMLVAIESFLHANSVNVLVTGTDPADNLRAIKVLQKTVKLDETLVVAPPSAVNASNPGCPLLSGKKAVDDQPSLYVCRQFECELPVVGVRNIETLFHPAR